MKIFYCYSKPLKDFLLEKGEKYFSKGKHFKTEKIYWMFEGTNSLNNNLEIWNSRKI